MAHSDVRVGEAILQLVLNDPLLLIGKDGTHFALFLDPEPTCHSASSSFQILHAYRISENMVLEHHHRSANFEIAFWDGTFDPVEGVYRRGPIIREQISLNSDWHSTFAIASRALARSMLFHTSNSLLLYTYSTASRIQHGKNIRSPKRRGF